MGRGIITALLVEGCLDINFFVVSLTASSDALSDNVFKSGLPTPKLSFPDVHVRQSSSSFKSKSGECCESESQESDIGNDDQGDLNDINKTPDSSSKILEKSTNLQPFMTTLSPTNHVTPTSFIVQETLLSSSSSAHTQDSSSSSSSSDESLKDTTNTQIPFHDNFSDHENHNADSHRMTTVVPLVLNLKGKEEVDEDMDYPWDTDNDESLEIDIEGSESGSDEALGQQSNSTSLYIQQTNINSKHNYEESILSNDDNTREKINEHIKWTKTDDNGQDDSTSISGSKNIIQMDPTNADVDSENGKLEGDRQSISKNENHEVEKKNTVRVGNKIKASENEEILQLLIKIAEDPEDWQEIRELLGE